MNWFKRLTGGLNKTASGIKNSIGSIFKGNKLDVTKLESLEDQLISCDIGIDVSEKLVKKLKSENRSEPYCHAKVYRPWGEYQSIYSEKGFLIKILRIYPKNKISLQYHNKRSEHWIVVEGIATVIKGKKKFKLKQNQSTYISKGEIHRLSNETNKNLTLVEVQTGSYLEEDDIVRLEDVYGRIKKN